MEGELQRLCDEEAAVMEEARALCGTSPGPFTFSNSAGRCSPRDLHSLHGRQELSNSVERSGNASHTGKDIEWNARHSADNSDPLGNWPLRINYR